LPNLAGTKENTLNQINVNTNFNLVGTVLVEREKHTANLFSNNLSKALLQESFYLSSGSPQVFDSFLVGEVSQLGVWLVCQTNLGESLL
jgi:hypothetical protein